jgi:signal transduction histidine kinase
VERQTHAGRAYAVTAAAAHELNNELTVILNSLSRTLTALEPNHPARSTLADLQRSAQRCAWSASRLLNYSARRGARPTAARLDLVIDIADRAKVE